MELVPTLMWEKTAEPGESQPELPCPTAQPCSVPVPLLPQVNPLGKQIHNEVAFAEAPVGAPEIHRGFHNTQERPGAFQLSSSCPFVGGSCSRRFPLFIGSPD